jgi:thiamine-phosphate pyrophosphorylase
MRVDLRLYAIVDPEHAGGHALPELARRVAAGGATLVQLRDKRGQTREMVAQARAIKAALAPLGVPFIVNDAQTACISVRKTWTWLTHGGCSGARPSSAGA